MKAFSTRDKILLALALGVIVVLFTSQLIAVATHRLDYPINDDWRYYIETPKLEVLGAGLMPERLTLEWLMAPARDTVHVTGKALDWLIFNLLSHDYHLLATLSFGVFFGGWLLCAAAFFLIAGRDDPVVLFLCLLLFCLPLAGSPYWVTMSPQQWLEPAIAYHQVLPVLGLLMLAVLSVMDLGRWKRGVRFVLFAAITTFFALTYSSGAVSLLLLGVTLLALTTLCPNREESGRGPLLIPGLAISVSAAICLAVHILLPLHHYDLNPALEARDYRLAYPSEGEFWRFFFGLFDRAVLSTNTGPVSFWRGILVAAAVVFPPLALTARLVRGGFESTRKRTIAIVVVAVLTAVLGYAALVTHGRAHFGKQYLPWDQGEWPTLYAHSRFFFWWITAVLPLCALGWALVLERTMSRRVVRTVVGLLVVLALSPKRLHPASDITYTQQWNYHLLYEEDARELEAMIQLDVAESMGQQRPSPRRDSISKWRFFQELRWRLRLGYKPAELFPVAQGQGATFVERWHLQLR
jgi:hypothetical protein